MTVVESIAAGADFRARVADKDMLTVLDYWSGLSRAAGGATPPRRGVDPLAIPKQLPHMQIFEREFDGRFRCRLAGTAVVAEIGCDATGRYLDEIVTPEIAAALTRLYGRVLEAGRPLYYSSNLETPDREYKRLRRLLLPLTDAQGARTYLLSIVLFQPVKRPANETGGPVAELVEMSLDDAEARSAD